MKFTARVLYCYQSRSCCVVNFVASFSLRSGRGGTECDDGVVEGGRPTADRARIISDNVLIKWFVKSQLPHKPVNLIL